MRDTVAVATTTTTTTNLPSYRPDRPRLLLLAREETGSDYRASPQSPPAPEDEPETVADWARVHARLVELSAERAAAERELCRWLLAAERLGVHARAGYGSLREYAGRLIGLSGRQTEERLRVGRTLAELPRLDRALGSGKLCFSAARELSRVATADTEEEWIDWARGKPSRQIEVAVAARLPGDRPRDRARHALVKHRLRFEVRAETMALFRDLQATVRRDLGGPVDDDTMLYEIARRALGGPGEAGRSSYQVALTRCAECGEASIDAGGRSHPVDRAVAEMAACDGQELGAVGGARGDGSHGSPSPQVGADHEGRAADAELPRPAPEPPRPAPELPRPAPELPRPAPASPQVGAEVAAATPGRRSSQTIPPAIRRAVLRRDRQRCAVHGCSNHLFLDVHHVDARSEGGSHDPDRLVCLCGSHHRQAHAGRLCIDGSATAGFTFRHADGAPYGQPLRPIALELAQQALGALRHLGFGPSRARALVDAVLQGSAPADLEAFVRAALEAS